jgi:hypothetical protein
VQVGMGWIDFHPGATPCADVTEGGTDAKDYSLCEEK